VGALIAANSLPLAGALLAGWDAGVILLLYWAENIIIGAYSVLKVITSLGGGWESHFGKAFLVPFFLLHYGGFCAVHGVFVSVFAGGRNRLRDGFFADAHDWPGPLVFIGLLVNVIRGFWERHGEELIWPLVALAASHGVSFVQNFLLRGEYRTAAPKDLMAGPYGRIVLLHVTLIAGGMPVLLLGSPLPLVVLLVVVKVVVDVFLHRRSHGAKAR
jgi:hypothetical protein